MSKKAANILVIEDNPGDFLLIKEMLAVVKIENGLKGSRNQPGNRSLCPGGTK